MFLIIILRIDYFYGFQMKILMKFVNMAKICLFEMYTIFSFFI